MIVFFAAGNTATNPCSGTNPYVSTPAATVISSASNRDRDHVVISNPTDKELVSVIRIRAPRGWAVRTDRFTPGERFTLKPFERVIVRLSFVRRSDVKPSAGTIDVMQEMFIGDRKITGGMTWELSRRQPKKQGDCTWDESHRSRD